MAQRPISRDGFQFAILCALPLEFDAVYDSFDEAWPDKDYGKAPGDPNRYATGRMGDLPVVLLLLPGKGKVDAASAAASLRSSYINLTLALVVGICGSIPYLSDKTEVVLGDVIISKYLVRYDFGRQYPDGFQRETAIEDSLGRPNKETRVLSAFLETTSGREKLEEEARTLLQQLQDKTNRTKHRGKYNYVGVVYDRLFPSDYRHKHHKTKECDTCDAFQSDVDPVCDASRDLRCAALGCSDDKLAKRSRLQEQEPPSTEADNCTGIALAVYVGGMGSADRVMKSGNIRDKIAKRDKIIGFEMEGAGVWDELPSCLVIKGVCDYADSHKSNGWQKYAAATAASTAKALLRSYLKKGQSMEELLKSILAVPFSRNDAFVGRGSEIHNMLELYDKGKSRIALFGMGGAGKTQVTLEFAYMIHERDPERNIFWLPAFSMTAFKQTCADLIQNLGIQSSQTDDAREQLQQYLSSERAGRWLLILDNVDNEEDLRGHASAPGIKTYLPQSQTGQVLLTTRWRKIAVEFAKTNVIRIAEMGQEDAKSLLQSSVITELSSEDDETMKTLLHLLAYLPLAIAQAAAYINIFDVSLDEYLQLCRHSQEDMMELLQSQYEDDTLYDESQGAVATTWLISFRQIQKQSPAAAKLLLFIMCIEPQAIPQSMLPDVGTEQEKLKAIGTLKGYGFLKARSELGLFDMHNLVHMVTQFWAKDRGVHVQNVTDALAHLSSAFQPSVWEKQTVWRSQLPHALHAFRAYRTFNLKTWSTLGLRTGECLLHEGRPAEAILVLQLALNPLQTTLAEDHPDRQAIASVLAKEYISNGQFQEGICLLERIVESRENTLAEDDQTRLVAQFDLANGYAQNKQSKEAIALLEHVVKVNERTFPEDHPTLLNCHGALAVAYRSDGQIEKAIPLLERVVRIQETTLDENHPDRLRSQHDLATAYEAKGQTVEAITLLEQVTRLRKMTLAESHPEQLTTVIDLVNLYSINNQTDQAISSLEHAIQICKKTLPEDDAHYLSIQDCLARAFGSTGRFEESIALLEHVTKMYKTLLAEDHPKQLASQAALAVAYGATGQVEEAIALYQKVIKIQERVLAEDDPALLQNRDMLALLYEAETSDKEEVA